jgi:hypothetical protein
MKQITKTQLKQMVKEELQRHLIKEATVYDLNKFWNEFIPDLHSSTRTIGNWFSRKFDKIMFHPEAQVIGNAQIINDKKYSFLSNSLRKNILSLINKLWKDEFPVYVKNKYNMGMLELGSASFDKGSKVSLVKTWQEFLSSKKDIFKKLFETSNVNESKQSLQEAIIKKGSTVVVNAGRFVDARAKVIDMGINGNNYKVEFPDGKKAIIFPTDIRLAKPVTLNINPKDVRQLGKKLHELKKPLKEGKTLKDLKREAGAKFYKHVNYNKDAKKELFNSLDNAVENDYDIMNDDPKDIADDIGNYDISFEGVLPKELISWIKEWIAAARTEASALKEGRFDATKIFRLLKQNGGDALMLFANGKEFSLDNTEQVEAPYTVWGYDEDGGEHEIKIKDIEFITINGKRIS